jgi:Family of unknown function (DUF6941)
VNIDWVIPCRFVEVHDNLATIVGAGIDTFWVPELPAPIQVFLAIRLLATPEELEAGDPHAIASLIRDPRGDLLSEARGEIRIDATAARPDWLVGMTIPGVMLIEATEEGTYTIEQEIDDASASLPIHVVLGLPPGVTPPGE